MRAPLWAAVSVLPQGQVRGLAAVACVEQRNKVEVVRRMKRPQWLPDNFVLTLLALLVLASVLPVRGEAAVWAGHVTNAAIALLFFLHGAKLSTQAVIQGLSHWRLHGVVLSVTFILFPLLAWVLGPVLRPLLGEELYRGMVYLSVLPSTVQSAIALTAMARGNVAAAVCGAATSSLLGIFITPLLVLVFMGSALGGLHFGDAVIKVMVQLLLPFVLGQIARRWIGQWVDKNKAMLKHVDQSSVYLVIYTAFSKAVVDGLWSQMALSQVLTLIACCFVLLVVVLSVCYWVTRSLGLNMADRITALFGGAQKSLATGVPMAQVLFAGTPMGALLLPLMLYHQVQLMTCAILARRFGQRPEEAVETGAVPAK